uniref:CUB domain-containing protein n=1 Tax=Caenorhabditis tropicalis TaxID=1561998 RepID=A0A1I7TNX5_9PELO
MVVLCSDIVFVLPCPCTPVLTIQNTTACPAANGKQPFTVRTPYFLASRCFASIIFEASNFRQNFFSFNGTNYLTTIGWIDSTGTCQARDVSIGGNGTAGTFYKINFPCDLSTMRFGGMLGGVNMVDLAEIAQFY